MDRGGEVLRLNYLVPSTTQANRFSPWYFAVIHNIHLNDIYIHTNYSYRCNYILISRLLSRLVAALSEASGRRPRRLKAWTLPSFSNLFAPLERQYRIYLIK